MRVKLSLSLVLLAMLATPASANSELKLHDWLARPNVRMVAVEFYATWCKPCMEAMPRWKALQEKYYDQGLRVIVVNVQDPDGGCKSIGFVPDDFVCDLQGRIEGAFGVNGRLPSAFLWSWQGNLLVKKGHIGEVESAVERYFLKAPRVSIEAGEGIDEAITTQVREALTNSGKVMVVADAAEQEALLAEQKKQTDLRYNANAVCEMGQTLPPNALLKVSAVGEGKNRFLALSLLDITRGCQLQSASARWSERTSVMASEAVSKLLGKLKLDRIQMPTIAAAQPSEPTPVAAPVTPSPPKPVANPAPSQAQSPTPGSVPLLDKAAFEKLLAKKSFERRLKKRLPDDTFDEYEAQRRSGGNFGWCWLLPGSCMYMLGGRGQTRNILYGLLYSGLYIAGISTVQQADEELFNCQEIDGDCGGGNTQGYGIIMLLSGLLGPVIHGYYSWDDYNRHVMREVLQEEGLFK